MKTDIIFINPGDKKQIFQNVGSDFSAIEPPYWIAVLSSYLKSKEFNVQILDANALNLSPSETADIIKKENPLLAAVIVYGSQPSASTQNMTIAGKICKAIKECSKVKIAIGGLHPSALPRQTLEEETVDFVIEGEGFITLNDLLTRLKTKKNNYNSILGLWYKENGKVFQNKRAEIIKDLNEYMPIASWELLPMDKYRAHGWHCLDNIDQKQPYAAIYTSLGCPYSCSFCCINAPFGKPGIRYRSPEKVVEEISYLVKKYKVKNIKLIDELFIFNENHYMSIIDLLLREKFDLNFWAYARLDTIKFENLEKMKKAGINWLALGIESASELVRDGVNKQMRKKNIEIIVKKIQSYGIRIIANYIFGLPDDTLATMNETLEFAKQLDTEWANFYCAMAYPGSSLYKTAIKEKWKLPSVWHGYSQHSYETLPLATKYLSSKQVLEFRDNAFQEYYNNPDYLKMIKEKFGKKAVKYIKEMSSKKLKRKLLE